MKFSNLFCLLIFVLTSACAHQGFTRYYADGIHKSDAVGASKDAATKEAYSTADKACKENNLRAAIVNSQCFYSGSQDEKAYNENRNRSGSLDFIRSSVHPESATPYKCEVSFKCMSIK